MHIGITCHSRARQRSNLSIDARTRNSYSMNMESSPASTHASDGAHIKLACQACRISSNQRHADTC